MAQTLSWPGADNGREGLLHADKWFRTLQILADNEGELITSYNSKLYKDLFNAMPDESWLGKDGNRSLFRDYQKSWTSLGVLKPTQDTNQAVVLTQKGRDLVKTGDVKEFFKVAIDGYTELWDVDGRPVLVSPYENIAHAIVLIPKSMDVVSVSELQSKAELLASIAVSKTEILKFNSSDTNRRRFRSYLQILDNAGAIKNVSGGKIQILEREYLDSLVRMGLLAVDSDSITMTMSLDDPAFEALPSDISMDLRRRKTAEQGVREGQATFARIVGKAYSYRCCVSGAKETRVLQAAHIMDYRGRQTNFPSNGLLMASDIHALFDAGRLLINPENLRIELPADMNDTRYLQYKGKQIEIPESAIFRPNREALARKYELCKSA